MREQGIHNKKKRRSSEENDAYMHYQRNREKKTNIIRQGLRKHIQTNI